MTNKQLQDILKKYPDNMPVKLYPNHATKEIIPMDEENILLTSTGAWVDDEADPETWDHEDGKIRDGGKKYLLINPLIV